jgi:hypothetical protein
MLTLVFAGERELAGSFVSLTVFLSSVSPRHFVPVDVGRLGKPAADEELDPAWIVLHLLMKQAENHG